MEWIVLLLLVWVFIGSAAYAGFSAAPWVPSRSGIRDAFLAQLILQPHYTIYDLGSGTGTLLFAMAKKEPNATYIGYELSVLPYLYSLCRKWIGGKQYKNISLRYGNIFRQTYADADVIVAFLLEKAYPKLKTRFTTAPDDCLIAVEGWPLEGVTPRDIVSPKNDIPMYVYEASQFKI